MKYRMKDNLNKEIKLKGLIKMQVLGQCHSILTKISQI